MVFIYFFVGLVVLSGLYLYFGYHDLGFLIRKWWIWLILIALSVPASLTVRGDKCSAGADWVRGRKSWVKIYELVSIKAKPSTSGLWLDLRDGDGRELDIEVLALQYNRRVWDLLYNGMLHSAVAGATVNRAAQRAFRLPDGSASNTDATELNTDT